MSCTSRSVTRLLLHVTVGTYCWATSSADANPVAVLQAFFLTAKVLHLGPVAVLSFRNRLAKRLQQTEEEAKVLERMLPRWELTSIQSKLQSHHIFEQPQNRPPHDVLQHDGAGCSAAPAPM
jgi:hypothetical protein